MVGASNGQSLEQLDHRTNGALNGRSLEQLDHQMVGASKRTEPRTVRTSNWRSLERAEPQAGGASNRQSLCSTAAVDDKNMETSFVPASITLLQG